VQCDGANTAANPGQVRQPRPTVPHAGQGTGDVKDGEAATAATGEAAKASVADAGEAATESVADAASVAEAVDAE